LSIIELAMSRIRGSRAKHTLSDSEARWARDLGNEIRQDQRSARYIRQGQQSNGVVIPLINGKKTEQKNGWREALRFSSKHSVLIASHLISAAAGAVVMWYVMGDPIGTQESSSQANPAIASSPAATATQTEAQVRDLIERWRQAWSRRDVQAYLTLYSNQFVPAKGSSMKEWAENRRKNFLGVSSISVKLHAIRLTPIDDKRVSVSLIQDYVSDRYTELGQPKTLVLIREGKDWRIVSEREG
jgi:hypothetical protein